MFGPLNMLDERRRGFGFGEAAEGQLSFFPDALAPVGDFFSALGEAAYDTWTFDIPVIDAINDTLFDVSELLSEFILPFPTRFP